MSAAAPCIEPLGESALLVRLGDSLSADTNAAVHALAARLRAQSPAAVREVVPAYASLAVLFDGGAMPGATRAALQDWLAAVLAEAESRGTRNAARLHTLQVRYGGEHGPDLDAVAAFAGISTEEVVRRHAAPTYTVAMLGFAPGFPYLLGLDPALAMPRLETPRPRVAAGSVALAGEQAGIYPQASPGGWRLLGHTQARLFDPERDPPALLAPGDQVRFVPA